VSRWYEAWTHDLPQVKAVEVDRVTEHSVCIGGRRRSIEGKYVSYFSEFQDAKRHVCNYHLDKVQSARDKLEFEQKKLAEAIRIRRNQPS